MVKMIEIVDSVEIFEDEQGNLVVMQNVYELTEEQFDRLLQSSKARDVQQYVREIYDTDNEPSVNYDVDE